MATMWKRIMWSVSLLAIFGVGYILFSLYHEETVYTIRQVDANGALLKPQTFRSGHVLTDVNYKKKVNGYKLISTDKKFPKRFGFTNQVITLTYKVKHPKKSLKQLTSANYLAAGYEILTSNTVNGFQEDKSDDHINNLRLMTSNDGTTWKTLYANYPNVFVRDPTPIRIHKKLVVLYTDGILTTSNLTKWTNKGFQFNNDKLKLQIVNSPDIFYGKNRKLNVVFSGVSLNHKNSKLYVTSFSKKKLNVGKKLHRVSGTKMSASLSDPHIDYHDGYYYLSALNSDTQELCYYRSAQPYSGYRRLRDVKLPTVKMLGPNVLRVGNHYQLVFNMINSTDSTVSVPYVIKFKNYGNMRLKTKGMQGFKVPSQVNSIGFEPQK
ncbi:hypothetical protein [Lactiplantibacillus plantarum]|uniref:hypothetical protein n=1 Tax=Lactiplantibacillus plantarum TaxID=1590 RepID=UPI001BA66403|nr:hypothetical protein [Lactiplantibacillus plantarum]MBS0937926.1 hypothetical protein [Lactiplantibacillus plantarum]MBS0944888.1 hypothetical protein [Lactiplantibacillus plantarum]